MERFCVTAPVHSSASVGVFGVQFLTPVGLLTQARFKVNRKIGTHTIFFLSLKKVALVQFQISDFKF